MSATTTERPILFNAPMVRALLDGRKTQTRRVMKPQPIAVTARGRRVYRDEDFRQSWEGIPGTCESDGWRDCPYGQPSDRLWVRETFCLSEPCYLGGRAQPTVWYAADSNRPTWSERKWKPSIHMPRRMSRIALEITDVRVQRLREISEEDAQAEGIERCVLDGRHYGWRNYLWHGEHGAPSALAQSWSHQFSTYTDPRGAFSSLWESINGAGSWDADPYVWTISFRRVQQEARP